jgi:predicted membrane protein
VYFDNAKIQSGNAVINVDVSFGDVNLFIPRSWNVVNEVHVFLGDMKCSHNNVASDSPTVVIRGNISFGDTSIIYV